MSDSNPVLDLDTEASQISVQAVPGAIFIRLRRDRPDGSVRRMFVEMSVEEALALSRELKASIGVAEASGQP